MKINNMKRFIPGAILLFLPILLDAFLLYTFVENMQLYMLMVWFYGLMIAAGICLVYSSAKKPSGG